MTMTNEEKARSLCCSGCNDYNCYTKGGSCVQLKNLMRMAEWKDEQVAEKCKHFLDHTCFGEYYNRQGILDVTKLFDDLIKFIKEEQP